MAGPETILTIVSSALRRTGTIGSILTSAPEHTFSPDQALSSRVDEPG